MRSFMHHDHDLRRIRCGVLTISDSRTASTDSAGDVIAAALQDAHHEVVWRALVRDEVEEIRQAALEAIRTARVQALMVTGGTGLTPRDVTPEAFEPIVGRILPGFGEQLRALSYAEVGVRGLLSRAFAAVVDDALVFALPGSPTACRTAMQMLVVPMLPHAAGLVRPSETTA